MRKVSLIILAYIAALLQIANVSCTEARRNVQLDWKIEYTNATRLCHTKSIVTVNGQFPGPTVYVNEGDKVTIKVTNLVSEKITIHWHGVKQHLTAWADGPAYITQCPIQTNQSYTYKFEVVGQRGTLFWHAHISWLRATVYGAFVIQSKKSMWSPYIPRSVKQHTPIVLGEWWNADVETIISSAIASGGRYNASDALTINGQPGALYNCSLEGTPVYKVVGGQTYLLRVVNAAVNSALYFAITNHTLTVVEHDAEYVQPYTTDVVLLAPGQTMSVLLETPKKLPTNQSSFAISATVYQPQSRIQFNKTPTVAVLQYGTKSAANSTVSAANLALPAFPASNDSAFELAQMRGFKSIKADVPQTVDEDLLFTVGYALQNCSDCPLSFRPGLRMGTAISDFGFVFPTNMSIQQAYYYNVSGVYEQDFPDVPLVQYNYTSNVINSATMATKVKVLAFGANVQVVLQDTGSLFFESHPMHLHGQNFYVVGSGVGTYNPNTDPAGFNLFDPPSLNTVSVPFGGWTAIRFQATNPGVWILHCHIEIHMSLGMAMAFIVKDGNQPNQILGPPPANIPVC